MIMDAIASFLVLPNRLTVPLVADLHVAQLRSPLPRVTHTQTLYTLESIYNDENTQIHDTLIFAIEIYSTVQKFGLSYILFSIEQNTD